ncbi:hypothetical protein HDU78_007045 [Chytriomyces hyalinus]|nr:hypothetical protein HDU78_007045 [Chytriomyces hyalinus]
MGGDKGLRETVVVVITVEEGCSFPEVGGDVLVVGEAEEAGNGDGGGGEFDVVESAAAMLEPGGASDASVEFAVRSADIERCSKRFFCDKSPNKPKDKRNVQDRFNDGDRGTSHSGYIDSLVIHSSQPQQADSFLDIPDNHHVAESKAVTITLPNQQKKIEPPNIISSTDGNYAAGAANLGLNTGTVVSLSVGGVAIVCAILGFAIFLMRKRAASRGDFGGDNAHEFGQDASSLPPPSPNGYQGYQGSMKLHETDHLLPLASLTSHSNLNKNNSLMSAGSSVSPVQSDSSYLSPSGDTTSGGLSYSPSVVAYHSPPPQPSLGEKGKAVNDIQKQIPLPTQEKDKSRFKEEEGRLFGPISASQFGGASSSGAALSDSIQPGLLSEYDRSRALNAKDEKRGMFLDENLGESSKNEKLGNTSEKGNVGDENIPAVSQRMNVLTCSPDMWEVEDVTLWMKAKGISHEFISLFQEHQITGLGLLALSEDVLREDLGIKAAGARQRLLELVAKLKEHETRPEDPQCDPSDAPPAYDEGDLS